MVRELGCGMHVKKRVFVCCVSGLSVVVSTVYHARNILIWKKNLLTVITDSNHPPFSASKKSQCVFKKHTCKTV